MFRKIATGVLTAALMLLPLTALVEAAAPNLVANPSMETVLNDMPQGWQSSGWGSQAGAGGISTDARTGSNSLFTDITAYTSGDSKWFFTPVDVTAGSTYTYTDYYKSTVATDVVVVLWSNYSVDAEPSLYLNDQALDIPASPNEWALHSTTFTVPASMTKATVYHLISSVGTLTIDDVSLSLTTSAPTEPTTPVSGVIPNGSVEVVDAANTNNPAGWQGANWGSNTAAYEWVDEGYNSSKSVKVTVSNYVDGDAKWIFNPITTSSTTLVRGEQYRFSARYKTNTIPNAVVHFTRDDNTDAYYGMPNPQPSADATTNWQLYSDTFTVPVDAKAVDIFFYLNNNGWVQTDDYSISPYSPVGFSQPLVSLTFDDGHEDNVTNALPLLNQYGFKTTQCYATQHIEGQQVGIDGVKAFYNTGHEICSHTITHPDLRTLTEAQLREELQHSKQVLEGITGTPVKNFASPYGGYNAAVNNVIDDYYQSHRTVDEGYNSKDNFDPYRLRVQNLKNTTTIDEFQSWLAHAKATNTWLILVYHRVASDADEFDTFPADFAAQLEAIKNSGLTVKTYQDALTDVWAQLGTNPTDPTDPTDPTHPTLKPGDVNGDGVVSLADLRILSKNYGKESGATRLEGDLTGDGAVGLADLRILSKNWSI